MLNHELAQAMEELGWVDPSTRQDSTAEQHIDDSVTFVVDEDVEVENKRLTLGDFSFAKSRELLKDVHINLSDAVIEERRSHL